MNEVLLIDDAEGSSVLRYAQFGLLCAANLYLTLVMVRGLSRRGHRQARGMCQRVVRRFLVRLFPLMLLRLEGSHLGSARRGSSVPCISVVQADFPSSPTDCRHRALLAAWTGESSHSGTDHNDRDRPRPSLVEPATTNVPRRSFLTAREPPLALPYLSSYNSPSLGDDFPGGWGIP